jgi:hypothetical protein
VVGGSPHGLLLREHLSRENLNSCPVPPGIGRQSCFETSLGEKLFDTGIRGAGI